MFYRKCIKEKKFFCEQFWKPIFEIGHPCRGDIWPNKNRYNIVEQSTHIHIVHTMNKYECAQANKISNTDVILKYIQRT